MILKEEEQEENIDDMTIKRSRATSRSVADTQHLKGQNVLAPPANAWVITANLNKKNQLTWDDFGDPLRCQSWIVEFWPREEEATTIKIQKYVIWKVSNLDEIRYDNKLKKEEHEENIDDNDDKKEVEPPPGLLQIADLWRVRMC